MNSILQKKLFFIILLFLFCFFMGLVVFTPVMNKVLDFVDLYSQVFIKPFPTIELSNKGITFLDPVPVELTIGNSIKIICDNVPDDTKLEGAVEHSILISPQMILEKNRDGIKYHDITHLDFDHEPVILSPDQINAFIKKYAQIILKMGYFVIIGLIFIIAIILSLLGGGIGYMIDTFENGTLSYIKLVNIAAIVFMCFNLGIYMLYNFGIFVFIKPYILLFAYFILVGCVVYCLDKYCGNVPSRPVQIRD